MEEIKNLTSQLDQNAEIISDSTQDIKKLKAELENGSSAKDIEKLQESETKLKEQVKDDAETIDKLKETDSSTASDINALQDKDTEIKESIETLKKSINEDLEADKEKDQKAQEATDETI